VNRPHQRIGSISNAHVGRDFHRREKEGERLLAYYQRTYAHMIPNGVEFLEWDEATGGIFRV
jgi:hypothetical protein